MSERDPSATTFPLGFDTKDLATQAQALCQQYPLYIDLNVLPRLQVTQHGLCLLMASFSPLKVEFASLLNPQRLDKTQALIRACKPKAGMTILDVTAGWGHDAGLLAQFGANITMLERQPVMAALLADGLQRLGTTALRLSCMHADALAYLSHLAPTDYPDLIYIDPMHPQRQKSALVKKNMQALQQLFGPDLDAEALLRLALTKAKTRVVVKWPQRLPPLRVPSVSLPGKTVRFDIYVLNH